MKSFAPVLARSARSALFRLPTHVAFAPRTVGLSLNRQPIRSFTETKKEKSRWNWFTGEEKESVEEKKEEKQPEEVKTESEEKEEVKTDSKTEEAKTEEAKAEETETKPEAKEEKKEEKKEKKEEKRVVSDAQKIQDYDILVQKLEELRGARADDRQKILSAWAEVENIRKTSQKDIESAKQFGLTGFSKDLLDVADNLTRALNSVSPQKLEESADLKVFCEGIVMTKNQMHKAFKKHGLEEFEPVLGEPFDYNREDGLFKMRDPTKKTGTIGASLKTGYTLNGRVIRAAQVGVVDNGDQD